MTAASNSLTSSPARPGQIPLWVQEVICIGLLTAVVTQFWWPALCCANIMVKGDAAHHGLTILQFTHSWLHGELESVLWSPDIYGGHPLFAESQGGFLNPINLIGAYLFEPAASFGVVHWLDMLCAGLGVYAMCRSLSADPWSSLFGACAAIFSMIWIVGQVNLSASGTLAWLPWMLATAQFWLNSPSLRRALLMSVFAALLLFSGYPHIAHSVVVYLVCLLFAWVLTRNGRQFIASNFKPLMVGGLVAVVFAGMLASVQLLPLIELVNLSHRQDGIGLLWDMNVGYKPFIASTLFWSWEDQSVSGVGPFGALAATAFAGLFLLMRTPYTIVGHLFALFFLFNLGMASSSPIFRVVYSNELIPGIQSFRIMHPYFPVAVIGLSAVAAYFLSALRQQKLPLRAVLAKRFNAVGTLCVYMAIFLLASTYFFTESLSILNYVFGGLAIVASLALLAARRQQLAPTAVAILFLVEIVVMRSNTFSFFDAEIAAPSRTAQAVLQEEEHRDFYVYSGNSRGGEVFTTHLDPELGDRYRRYVSALAPFPAAASGIPSIEAALALKLQRRAMVSELIEEETADDTYGTPGSRVIDALGIKYIPHRRSPNFQHFELLYLDKEFKHRLYVNPEARSRFRGYSGAVFAVDATDALSKLTEVDKDELVVEISEGDAPTRVSECEQGNDWAYITWVERSPVRYSANIQSRCDGWLYIGDAHYPGWQAQLNGQAVSLYPANVLGKAVYFPAGESNVVVEYKPRSFAIGAFVSSVAWLTLLAAALLQAWRSTRRHPSAGQANDTAGLPTAE